MFCIVNLFVVIYCSIDLLTEAKVIHFLKTLQNYNSLLGKYLKILCYVDSLDKSINYVKMLAKTLPFLEGINNPTLDYVLY